MEVDPIDDARATAELYAYVALDNSRDIHAAVAKATYSNDDEEIVLPDLIFDDPDAEENIGALVCERLKKCRGRVEFAGKVVCQGLHPAEVMADLRRFYSID